MNILFYTSDLYHGRERLMPWRTILEIAKVMQKHGHRVIIINGVSENKHLKSYVYENVHIHSIKKDLNELAKTINSDNTDVLMIECKWRDAIKGFNTLKTVKCSKYAYFTGGIYDFKSVKLLAQRCGIKNTIPYLLESIVPKKLVIYRLKKANFDGAIGLTPLTSNVIRKSGLKNHATILPGKDNFETLKNDNTFLDKYHLSNKRFLCFTGAPAQTRGADLLLQAVDKSKINDLRVVFLMRNDVGSKFEVFNKTYAMMKHPERIIIIRENLTREQLKAFFTSAWYMVLPFIVIPSEIPLTFFEIMSCGTPILTFKNGGTSDYLNRGLEIAQKSIIGLQKGIENIWTNETLRYEKSLRAKQLMDSHPTWEKTTELWSYFTKIIN